MIPSYPQVSLDCYVRASAPGEIIDGVIETLHSYDGKDVIDEFTVELWPEEVRLTEEAEDSAVLAHYDRFRAWADGAGVSLEPAFTRRRRTPLVGGDTETFLVVPVVCLAIRVDGELVRVAPHSTDTRVYTVADALSDIESLPRLSPFEDPSDFPPGHPVRSATTSHTSEGTPARDTGEETLTEQ